MGTIKHFTDLEVWQRSHKLFLALVEDVDTFPRRRAAVILTDQVLRSAGSIGGNIAEGFNRSKAKFLNSLDIALGEANETENWLYKIRDAKFLLPRGGQYSHRRDKDHLPNAHLTHAQHSGESRPEEIG